MESTVVTAIATEVKGEMQLAPSVSMSVLEQYVKEGADKISRLVIGLGETINFDTDLSARSLLKNYVRYAFYGALDEFYKNYQGDIYDTQAQYL